MDKPHVAECEACGRRALVCSRYMRYDATLDLWHMHCFCCGKCSLDWLRAHEALPNPGITTSFRT